MADKVQLPAGWTELPTLNDVAATAKDLLKKTSMGAAVSGNGADGTAGVSPNLSRKRTGATRTWEPDTEEISLGEEWLNLIPSAGYSLGEMAARAGETVTTGDAKKFFHGQADEMRAEGRKFAPTRGGITGTVRQGVESTIQSVSAGLPGAAAGGAVGGPVGAAIGFALGAGGMFTASEYSNFLADVEEQARTNGATEQEVEHIRREMRPEAVISAASEGGFEAASDLFIGRLIGLLGGKTLKVTAKKGVVESVKRALATYGKAAAVEVPGEAATAAVQTETRKAAGVEGMPSAGESALDAVGPTLVQTALMLGGGHGAKILANRKQAGGNEAQAAKGTDGDGKVILKPEAVNLGAGVILDGQVFDSATGEYVRDATPEEIAGQQATRRNGLDNIIDRRTVERAKEQTASATAQATETQEQNQYDATVDELVLRNPDQYEQIRKMQERGEPLHMIQGIVQARAEMKAKKENPDRREYEQRIEEALDERDAEAANDATLRQSPRGAELLREQLKDQQGFPGRPNARRRKDASIAEIEDEMFGPGPKTPPLMQDIPAWNEYARQAGLIGGDEQLDLDRLPEISRMMGMLRDNKIPFEKARGFFKGAAVKKGTAPVEADKGPVEEIPQGMEAPQETEEGEGLPEKPVDNKGTGVYRDGKYLNIRRDRINAEDTPALASILGMGVNLPGGKKLAEVSDLFDGVRVYGGKKGWAKPYDENTDAQEDQIADNYAQILHDYHGAGEDEGGHSLTFSDVLDRAQEELSELIDNRHKTADEIRAEKVQRANNGGYTDAELKEMEAQYAALEEDEDGRSDKEEIDRLARRDGEEGFAREIQGMEGESEEDVLAFFSDLAEQASHTPETPQSTPDLTADHTTAITDLTDSATGQTIPAGTPHHVLNDGRIFSEESYRELRNTGEQQGLFAPGEKTEGTQTASKKTPEKKTPAPTITAEPIREKEAVQTDMLSQMDGQEDLFAAYSARKVRPSEAGVKLEEVREAFPKAKVRQEENGDFVVEDEKGNSFRVVNTEEISPDERVFEVEYGRKMRDDEAIAGKYEKGTDTISITRHGDRWTLRNESYKRLVMRGFLSTLERGAVKRAAAKELGKESGKLTFGEEANWVEKALQERDTERKGLAGKAIQKLRDLVDGLVNLHHATARGVLRGMERGETNLKMKKPSVVIAEQQSESAVAAPPDGSSKRNIRELSDRVKPEHTPGNLKEMNKERYSVRESQTVNQQFNRDIEELVQKGRVGKLYLNLGKPGEILSKFMPKLAIRIGVGKIHKILKDHPGVDLRRNFHDLPVKINDPVAILRSKTEENSIVILVSDVDNEGSPVVTPVHVGVADRWDTTRQTNILASVFGAKPSKFINQLNEKPDDLLYYNHKKGSELCSGAAGSNSLMDGTSPIGSDSLTESKVRSLNDKLQQVWNTVKGNREKQIQDEKDTWYSVRQRNQQEQTETELTDHVLDFFGGLKDSFSKLPGKPDLSKLDWITLPQAWAEKIPALKRMVGAAVKIPDLKYQYQGKVFGTAEDPEEHLKALAALARKNPKEYEKLGKYLFLRDKNRWGYRVDYVNDGWILINPNNVQVGKYETDTEAWAQAIVKEGEDLRAAGYSEEATAALQHVRQIGHNMFGMLHRSVEEIIQQAEERGEDIPEVEVRNADGQIEAVNLRVALARMGDLRGSYMPRQRQSGRYMVTAKKAGENPRMEFFLTRLAAETRRRKLERQGYTVKTEKTKGLNEDVYGKMGGTMAIEALMNTAVGRMGKNEAVYTINDFGYGVNRDNGKLILQGLKRKGDAEVFKKHGGNIHPGSGNMYQWVFTEANAELEKAIVQDLLEAGSIPNQTPSMFYKLLAEGVADVLREHGALSHRLARNKATGKDVWLGYEEDPIRAMAMAGSAISGAAAKHDAARNMYRAIDGTDISWTDWKAGHEGGTYQQYQEFAKGRGIDPERQQEAHKTALEYFQDVLRNDEAFERLAGIGKGLATLKYLAFRVSTPLVNLTSLGTASIPNISAIGGVTLRSASKHLAAAAVSYGKYLSGRASAEEKALFEEIEKRGWANPQFNRELLGALRSSVGNMYDRIIDVGMWMNTQAEIVNRVTTIAGAYRAIRAKHQGEWTGEAQAAAMEKAKEISDASNAVYGKSNTPMAFRGGNFGAVIGRQWMTFQTYPINFLLRMKQYFEGDKQSKYAALWMATSGGILGGAKLAIPVAIMLQALKWTGDDDPEEMLYGWIEEHLGGLAHRFARFGAAGLAGVSFKGSLDTGVANLIPDPHDPMGWAKWTVLDILGAPGAVVKDEADALRFAARGDLLKALEKALPAGLGNPIRAVREATTGQTTRFGTPVFWGQEKVRASKLEMALRAVGFNPIRLAEISEKRNSEYKVDRNFAVRKDRILGRMKANRMAERTEENREEWFKLIEEARKYNQQCPPDRKITRLGIQAALRRTERPPKRERMRAREEREN